MSIRGSYRQVGKPHFRPLLLTAIMQAHGTRHHDLFGKGGGGIRTAESEFANGRYNSCANRCYYACFRAGSAAFLAEGIGAVGKWILRFVRGNSSVCSSTNVTSTIRNCGEYS